jgi:hypothetical protein
LLKNELPKLDQVSVVQDPDPELPPLPLPVEPPPVLLPEQLEPVGTQFIPTTFPEPSPIYWQLAPLGHDWPLLQSIPQ